MSLDGFSIPEPPSAEALAKFALNDDGNAMRFICMAGGAVTDDGDVDVAACRVLYLRHRGWIVFNGRHWDLETGEALARRHAVKVARAMAPAMQVKIDKLAEEKDVSAKYIQSIRDFATQAGNKGRIEAMMALAASYLDVPLEAFDPDPMALNCANGVVRFRRGEDGKPRAIFQQGHNPADRFTRMTRAEYRADAKAPRFRGVVDFAQPKAEDRRWLNKALGYSSTGDTGEQKFFVFQGKGGDSKSTVVNACRFTLGTYGATVGIETFLDTGVKRGSEASPDIASLAGDTRFLSAGEPPSGAKLATGAIKAFTGGGNIKTRELRESMFEFSPKGKPIIECNRKPQINDTDNGIWRRLKILPWTRQVAEADIDPALPGKLEAEADGILAWLCEGVLAWMEEGLKDTDSVREAVEDYRKGGNPFLQWFEDRVVREEGVKTESSVFYADYKRWMEDNGHDKPMSQKSLVAALGDLQIPFGGKNSAGRMTRRGARLRRDDDGPGGGAPPARADDPGPGAGGPLGGEPYPDSDVEWPDDQPEDS